MSHTVYTPYNIESKLFSVYYTFVRTFTVFKSFQPLIAVLLCCVIQKVGMESSSSKHGNFVNQNILLEELLAGRRFLDIS